MTALSGPGFDSPQLHNTSLVYNALRVFLRKKNHLRPNSLKRYYATLRMIGDEYPDLEVHQLNLSFYEHLLNRMYTEWNYVPSTAGKYIELLKQLCKWLELEGVIQKSNFSHWKRPRNRKQLIALTKEEIELLVAYSGKNWHNRIRDIFLILCYTGLRFGDYKENLVKEAIGKKSITLLTQKCNEPISIPLSTKLEELLEKYDYSPPKVSNPVFNRTIKEVCMAAGLNRRVIYTTYKGNNRENSIKLLYELVTAHTARKTFTSLCVHGGVPVAVVARILGHRDVRMIMEHYYKFQAEKASKMLSEIF